MKECSKCSITKEFSEFNKNRTTKDGLRFECRECQREQMKKYRERNAGHDKKYYEANKHEISLRKKKYYQDNLDKHKAWRDKYFKENKDAVLQAGAIWSKNNPEKMKEYRRNYKERHRERIIISENNREAAKRSLLRSLTERDLETILELFDFKCVICFKNYEHLDHFLPLSSMHGGTTKENIVPKCAKCNISKRDKNPFEWAKTLTPEQRTNFDKVVEYLAELNELTVDEYREFVFWCFENKRDIDEITDDNRDSLALWKRKKSAA